LLRRPYFFVKLTRKNCFGIAIIGYLIYNIIEAQNGAVKGSVLDDFNCVYESLRGRNGRA
jgi:hypothetical protein